MTQKKRYIKVKQPTLGSSYIEPPESKLTLSELLEDALPGEDEGYLISIIEITDAEFEEMPEFDGF